MAQQVQDILAAATAVQTTLTNIAAGIKALDDLITQLQSTPGPVTQADLDNIQAAVKGLVDQSAAISTTPPSPVPNPGPV